MIEGVFHWMVEGESEEEEDPFDNDERGWGPKSGFGGESAPFLSADLSNSTEFCLVRLCPVHVACRVYGWGERNSVMCRPTLGGERRGGHEVEGREGFEEG